MSFLAITQHPEWKAALDQDDPALAARVLEPLSRSDGYLALAMTLGHPGRPEKVLDFLVSQQVTDGLVPSSWLLCVARERLDMDWGEALRWLGERMDPQALREQVAHGWSKLLELHYQTPKSGPLLCGMAQAYPDLVQQAATGDLAVRLFFLSVDHPQMTWPEASGVALEGLLRAGMKEDWRMEDVMRPPPAGGVSAFDVWMSQQPARQAAYQRVLTQDKELLVREAQWCETWLEGGRWENSTLQQWCEDMCEQGYSTLDPHTDEILFGKGATEGPLATHTAHLYMAIPYAGNGDHIARTAVRQAHNHARSQRQCAFGQLLQIPIIPLALGLDNNADWAGHAMQEGHDQDQAMALLEDPRAGYTLQSWKGANVATWILEQPTWQTWRNTSGESLLDVWVGSQHAVKKKATLSLINVLAIARRCPELLQHADPLGVRLLNRLDINETVRSQARRIMLDQQLSVAGERRKARARLPGRM